MNTILAWYTLLFYAIFIGAPIALGVWAWQRRDRAWRALRDWYQSADAPQINVSANATAQQINQPVIVVEHINGKPTVVGRRETDANGTTRFIPLQLPPPKEADQAVQIMQRLNNDGYHRLIIGSTGGGKTTLIHALASDWARQQLTVVVCDPDAAPGMWPGCHVVGYGDDFVAIAESLERVFDEVEQRRDQRGAGQRAFSALHLVCDEVQDVVAECDRAWTILETILRRGRKLNVLLTIGVQDRQVKTLGLEGKSHLLGNLIQAEVKRRDGQRVAIIDGESYVLPVLVDPDSLIVAGSPFGGGRLGGSGTSPGTSSVVVPSGSNALEPLEPIIRNMAAEGMSRNQIARLIGGRKQDALDRIRRVLGDSIKEEL